MALFHLSRSSISKSNSKAGTAGAHILYQHRKEKYADRDDLAYSESVINNLKVSAEDYVHFITEYENNSRANAKLLDKVITALPREFNLKQQIEVTQKFIERLNDKLSNHSFAIHHDNENPHCHISFLARDTQKSQPLWTESP